jgi:hypothetical protein
MTKFIKYIVLQIIFWGILSNFNYSFALAFEGIWIPEKITWEKSDIKEQEDMRYARTMILQFLDDGNFTYFSCVARLQDDGIMDIILNEDFSVFKGRWKMKNEKEILVTYRAIYRTVEVQEVDEKGEVEKKETDKDIKKLFKITTDDKDKIRIFDGQKFFIKSNKLSEGSKKDLNRNRW